MLGKFEKCYVLKAISVGDADHAAVRIDKAVKFAIRTAALERGDAINRLAEMGLKELF
jgi:hypothetical protein